VATSHTSRAPPRSVASSSQSAGSTNRLHWTDRFAGAGRRTGDVGEGGGGGGALQHADKALLLQYLSDQSRQRELDLEEAHQTAQHGGRGDGDDDDLHQVPEEEQEMAGEGVDLRVARRLAEAEGEEEGGQGEDDVAFLAGKFVREQGRMTSAHSKSVPAKSVPASAPVGHGHGARHGTKTVPATAPIMTLEWSQGAVTPAPRASSAAAAAAGGGGRGGPDGSSFLRAPFHGGGIGGDGEGVAKSRAASVTSSVTSSTRAAEPLCRTPVSGRSSVGARGDGGKMGGGGGGVGRKWSRHLCRTAARNLLRKMLLVSERAWMSLNKVCSATLSQTHTEPDHVKFTDTCTLSLSLSLSLSHTHTHTQP
jgi:hypothetical protein